MADDLNHMPVRTKGYVITENTRDWSSRLLEMTPGQRLARILMVPRCALAHRLSGVSARRDPLSRHTRRVGCVAGPGGRPTRKPIAGALCCFRTDRLIPSTTAVMRRRLRPRQRPSSAVGRRRRRARWLPIGGRLPARVQALNGYHPRPVAQNAATSGCAQAGDFLLNFAIPAGAIRSELMSNSGFGHSPQPGGQSAADLRTCTIYIP